MALIFAAAAHVALAARSCGMRVAADERVMDRCSRIIVQHPERLPPVAPAVSDCAPEGLVCSRKSAAYEVKRSQHAAQGRNTALPATRAPNRALVQRLS